MLTLTTQVITVTVNPDEVSDDAIDAVLADVEEAIEAVRRRARRSFVKHDVESARITIT